MREIMMRGCGHVKRVAEVYQSEATGVCQVDLDNVQYVGGGLVHENIFLPHLWTPV